ncbi:hypothetical protein AYL99_08572 [Fonsecaea erecta]|uniref:Zn(2)-C6 fungal-type domain-containing protein n=1 Tax=Fonsecaea erecta TaxID=1367422 RepID=A0A178ZDF1_9EURO|nr:hypothetical protein AYL99_08572 [Fonsecaea erecta]OAP57834.1 hypothetical protein AYL99_08572 [Fonsecaea erecta]
MSPRDATANNGERIRAAKACKPCNGRRIRCDAVVRGTPCSNCIQRNDTGCFFPTTSKRGLYARAGSRGGKALSKRSKGGRRRAQQASEDVPPEEASPVEVNPTDFEEEEAAAAAPDSVESLAEPLWDSQSLLAPSARSTTGSTLAESNTVASYRQDAQWYSHFGNFVDSHRQPRPGPLNKRSITYLGETLPLALVLQDLKGGVGGSKPRLHYSGPAAAAGEAEGRSPDEQQQEQQPPPQNHRHQHPSHLAPEDIAFLEAKHAFTYPAPDVLDSLISVFLERVVPMYPVVNQQEFLQQYKSAKLPCLLNHAVCVSAATFCPIADLVRAGFPDRRQAKSTMFKKAKALLDTGYEESNIVIIQSLILLTFCGGGPNSLSNYQALLSMAVTMAENLGIHRSLERVNMNPQDRSLLKRLWWTLTIRDAACCTITGRPFRIEISHSDAEMLTLDDFAHDDGQRQNVYPAYQIAISKLSLILREIVSQRWDPGRRKSPKEDPIALLTDWRRNLPPEVSFTDRDTDQPDPLICSLAICYHHHRILSHLEAITRVFDDHNHGHDDGEDGDTAMQIVVTSAHRIAALSSAIATRSKVLHLPHETFHGLWLAQFVFLAQMRSKQQLVVHLGRSALSTCQLVLHEVLDSWEPAQGIIRLFKDLMKRIDERAALPDDHHHYHPEPAEMLFPFATTGTDSDFGGQVAGGTGSGSTTMTLGGELIVPPTGIGEAADLWPCNFMYSMPFFHLSYEDGGGGGGDLFRNDGPECLGLDKF